jgi:16S rRNA (cytosine1402-N4)-methyltransferase
LVGIDFDQENLSRAREQLTTAGNAFTLHHGNFAGLPAILGSLGLERIDIALADLGMSSMQVDDPERGFSYRRDGPLDMRMDRSRGRTVAEVLKTVPERELAEILRNLGDEPNADLIAANIVAARQSQPIERTHDLVRVVTEATRPGKSKPWRLHPQPGKWELHPAARTFQALRIFVNRELTNLEELLRVLPDCLRPGGRAAIITFHSGEDRLVKSAFRAGLEAGVYSAISPEPIRASFDERASNPRARSAKLRWAMRASS